MEDLLKEFWPVALFVVISIISYARNDAKAKKAAEEQPTPPHTLNENFPTVEVFEHSATADATKRSSNYSTERVKKATTATQKATIKGNESQKAAVHTRGAKVALKGKSDVKKAFIYSEILNRKY